MSMRSKIIAFQVFFVGLILVMVAVVHFAIARADQFIERVALTHRQLEEITELSLRANRYSEQIAEMLLFGQEGVAEFEEARRELEASFVKLEQVTRAEIASLQDEAERLSEQRELALIENMRTTTRRMHDAALELLDIVVSGRQDVARQIEVDLEVVNRHACIRVRNEGPGVPPEDLPFVFDRFYRGRHGARGIGGSGLGLSIAKWIVDKHDGTITLSSEPNGVTELEIRLASA